MIAISLSFLSIVSIVMGKAACNLEGILGVALQEGMDRCAGHCNTTKIIWKMVLNINHKTIASIHALLGVCYNSFTLLANYYCGKNLKHWNKPLQIYSYHKPWIIISKCCQLAMPLHTGKNPCKSSFPMESTVNLNVLQL